MVPAKEYAKRRKALMRAIGANAIVVIPAAKQVYRNADSAYAYRQQSDFYYLTGFEEPEAILVLAPKRKEGEYLLFNRSRDPDKEVWDGPRAGQKGACQLFAADQAFPIEEFENALPHLLAGRTSVHYPLGMDSLFDQLLIKHTTSARAKVRGGIQSPSEMIDITPTLHEMRLFKNATEVAVMQKAVDITAAAHIRAMQYCQPGIYEYELEAELMHEFYRQGARAAAYTSIVGAGENSCVLHYIANNKKIKNKDLVLIDAGAEYQNYAADITRTFPANGKFTPEQRDIYEIVLASQLAAIKSIQPGASWDKAQMIIVKILTQGLVDVGILKGSVDGLIEQNAYFPFYMHRSGHWLGLDVHDAGSYRINNKWRPLEPGMMLTVEPGLYISDKIPGVAKRWHHIGIRIEDDVLVTPSGHRVLSQQIPKTVADIEATMAHS